MSAIKPTTAERIREIRATYDYGNDMFEADDVADLLAAIDHVIAVLRQAERCGGGYGFARQLLRYLGADQEEQG